MRLIAVERTVRAGRLPGRRFHLHHISAQSSQHLPAVLAQLIREFEHADTLEECSCNHHNPPLTVVTGATAHDRNRAPLSAPQAASCHRRLLSSFAAEDYSP